MNCRIFVFALFISTASFAQNNDTLSNPILLRQFNPPVSVETFASDSYLNFQMIVNKRFKQDSKFSFFNVTNFNGNYDNDLTKNEFLTQGMINFEIYKGFSLGTGATMNYRTGFRPTAGLQYSYGERKWLLVLLPRVDLRDDYNFETFALLEYKPQLTKQLGLYTRMQVLYNQNVGEEFHDRSYLYLRLGLSYQHYQFGIGANFDRYGPMKVSSENYGIFARILLFN